MKIKILLLALFAIAVHPVAANAGSVTKFKLEVEPLICTFESVNNGVSQTNLLAPESCGDVDLTDLQAQADASALVDTASNADLPTTSSQLPSAEPLDVDFTLRIGNDISINVPTVAVISLASIGAVALLAIMDIKFFGYGIRVVRFILQLLGLVPK